MLIPDPDEMLHALQLLTEPGQLIELRLLNVQPKGQRFPAIRSGYFTDHRKLAQFAATEGKYARGVYVTLNPANPALLARAANRLRTVGKDDQLTSDADIAKRLWLPIDVDPVRPAGISATDEEHACALDRAYEIREAMRQQSWPDPVVGDSGNGGHLLYRVNLPSNDDGLVKRCLCALANRFDDGKVIVDQAVFNPARIWKLYGTVSRKGDDRPDRPHRLARIVEAP